MVKTLRSCNYVHLPISTRALAKLAGLGAQQAALVPLAVGEGVAVGRRAV